VEHLIAAADQFKFSSRVTDIQEFGHGNVHDTFRVTLDTHAEKHFILQRINTQVFRQPELVMGNIRTVSDHVQRRLERTPVSDGRRWETPHVLPTKDARDLWIDPGGSFWRAISFIDAAQTFDTIQDVEHAREIGLALGLFHSLISDLPTTLMADTLPGFHITPCYLSHFDEVLAKHSADQSSEVDYALKFVLKHRAWAQILEQAKWQGRLSLRPIHGDPKVNNVMIDTATRQAVSLIDLDTVKPGLVQYDIGDCLRSCCNLLGEDTQRWETVRFELDLCQIILQGYFSQASCFLTGNDYAYLADAIRLIAFELGLRFLTDYLAGDVYFKVKYPKHNLARALVQFKLAESIESQAAAIGAIIQDLR
jgi:Ser/Thr protein kinase RdoA (MazF antagonist)